MYLSKSSSPIRFLSLFSFYFGFYKALIFSADFFSLFDLLFF